MAIGYRIRRRKIDLDSHMKERSWIVGPVDWQYMETGLFIEA